VTDYRARHGPHNSDDTYVSHQIAEMGIDLDEFRMNYATAGDVTSPPLLLIPGQTESWWGVKQSC